MKHQILSELTGTVAICYAESGCDLQEGDPILELECMKLLTRVNSPAHGKLNLKVSLGDFVTEGEILAEVQ